MKYIYKLLLVYVLFVINTMFVAGQNPLSLYYLENVPQSMLLNPAMTTRANVYIGLPGLSSVYAGFNSDIYGRDLIQEQNGKYVTLTQKEFDYSKFYNKIGNAANLGSYQMLSPIIFGFKTKVGYFSFSWTEKLTETLSVPRDFFSIIEKGFPNGAEYDFHKLGTMSQYYREFSVGYAFNLFENLTIGFHAKYLTGLAAVKSDIDKFSLNTGVDRWDVEMDGDIYMYAPVYVSYNEDGIPSLDSIPSDTETWLDKGVFNFSNPGLAFDIGAVYDLNEDWSFSASITDIGFISWKGEDLNSFSVKGKYSFDGVYVDNNNIDSLDNAADDILDSLKTAMDFTHGKKTFSSSIGSNLYVGAQYKFNHYLSMGLLSRTVFSKYNFRQEFNLSANFNLYHFLTTSFSYTLGINGSNALGLGLGLRGGPVQFYMALDYLPYNMYKKVTIVDDDNGTSDPTSISFLPKSLGNVNIMFGINILLGPNGFKDEPMIDSYKEF